MVDEAAAPVFDIDATHHTLVLGDARSLEWVADASIHLAVTSPPYWILKKYNDQPGQLGPDRMGPLCQGFCGEEERTEIASLASRSALLAGIIRRLSAAS